MINLSDRFAAKRKVSNDLERFAKGVLDRLLTADQLEAIKALPEKKYKSRDDIPKY